METLRSVTTGQRHIKMFNPTFGLQKITKNWYLSKDGDTYARSLFKKHYSYRAYKDGRTPKLFVGPGQKMVLVMEGGLFVWRKYISNQEGINCAVFRNETKLKSSELILEAELASNIKWEHPIRLFTFVNKSKVKSKNAGYCFKKAGWKTCGITKWNKLIILEKFI